MRVVPKKPLEMGAFYGARLRPWGEAADEIGLNEAEVAELGDRVDRLRRAALRRGQAMAEARAATQEFHQAAEALGAYGSRLMTQVRAAAVASGDLEVYVKARIPAPKTPASVAAPGRPYAPRITLSATGAVTLAWQCKNPPGASGTMYELRRSINGRDWQPVAITGQKRHTDTTIPAGASCITYQIRAVRSTAVGSAAVFTVQLGGSARQAA